MTYGNWIRGLSDHAMANIIDRAPGCNLCPGQAYHNGRFYCEAPHCMGANGCWMRIYAALNQEGESGCPRGVEIRRMSDEQLAEAISKELPCGSRSCPAYERGFCKSPVAFGKPDEYQIRHICDPAKLEPCRSAALKWLKSEI